uniref:Uncharacterized protein n=1 Tax=Papio anubis TaxID=9555 RepID=A0A8I5R0D0_PAPAN
REIVNCEKGTTGISFLTECLLSCRTGRATRHIPRDRRACFDDPAGRDTWRPTWGLETRDSVRKRTPKDGRPLTQTKGVKLFRSPREPAASESKKMKPKMRFLWKIIALYSIVTVYAGFGDPRKARELIRKQYGQPCDCSGGQISEPPSDRITQVTCSGKTAYLMPNQLWKCTILRPGKLPTDSAGAT